MCLLSVCIVSNIVRWSELVHGLSFQVGLLYSEDDMVVMSGDVGCDVRCWHSGRNICVERYMIRVRECFGNQFTTMVICV